MTLSSRNKAGLAIAALLGAVDIAFYFFPPDSGTGEPDPPAAVLIFGLGVGLVTLVSVYMAFRAGSRWAIHTTVAARALSALSAVPAYFVDVSTNLKLMVTAFILATLVSIWLIYSKRKA